MEEDDDEEGSTPHQDGPRTSTEYVKLLAEERKSDVVLHMVMITT